jgi:coenzyme F420-reducing hydrogenase alpha subunit
MHGETLQSHCLHIFFLAAPDFLDQPSALPLLQSHPGIVRAGLQLKELGNTISEAITGRATHPVSMVIGGMSRAPGKDQLLSLKTMLQKRVESLEVAQSFFLTLAIPDFVRPTEFISLRNPSTYPSIGGDIISSDGLLLNENDYLRATNEYKPDFSTSKFTKASRESSVAGALARVNNNYDQLHPKSRAFAEAFGLKPLCHNPFMNTIAQLVECHHILLDAARLVDELLDMELSEIKTTYRPKAGAATGAVEAPRGILYHHMETDEKGKVVRADCIIPTTQNNANIHYDLHALVSQTLEEGKSERETEKLCVMLVRSYDPCISCSVH